MKKEFCINATHRLEDNERPKTCEESDYWCKKCYEEERNRPTIKFDPNALR